METSTANLLAGASPTRAGDCRCGCGRPEIPDVAVQLTQLTIVRALMKELETLEPSAIRDDLLYGGQRALWGLEGYCHQDWRNLPVQLGLPTPSWIELWRERVKESATIANDSISKSVKRKLGRKRKRKR